MIILKTIQEIKKEDLEKQFLSSNNAISFFIKVFVKVEKVKLLTDLLRNKRRYHLIVYENPRDKEINYAFVKFTEYPYFKAKGGFSESINVDMMREIMGLYNRNQLKYVYFIYKSGYILRTEPINFLKFGWKETDKEGTERYILNWNQKDENENFCFENYINLLKVVR